MRSLQAKIIATRRVVPGVITAQSEFSGKGSMRCARPFFAPGKESALRGIVKTT